MEKKKDYTEVDYIIWPKIQDNFDIGESQSEWKKIETGMTIIPWLRSQNDPHSSKSRRHSGLRS